MIAQKFFSPMITPTIEVRDRFTSFFNDVQVSAPALHEFVAELGFLELLNLPTPKRSPGSARRIFRVRRR
jgi:hypothetical protein